VHTVRSKLVDAQKDERGFTLPEVLVTIITVMFAFYAIFDMSIRGL
jgi:prepilin-type N-terminal cleavage/methylation domain-containing protein